jgi:prepilin-type processing-associated H-X9-DG protein
VNRPNSRSCNWNTDVRSNMSATSRHVGGGVNVLMCDGSARFVSENITLSLWTGLGSRNGKEPLGDL